MGSKWFFHFGHGWSGSSTTNIFQLSITVNHSKCSFFSITIVFFDPFLNFIDTERCWQIPHDDNNSTISSVQSTNSVIESPVASIYFVIESDSWQYQWGDVMEKNIFLVISRRLKSPTCRNSNLLLKRAHNRKQKDNYNIVVSSKINWILLCPFISIS